MKQSEIDAFYDKIIRGLPDDEIDYLASRAPANEKPQVQSETVITPNIITPVPGLKYPIAENLRQNLDTSLMQREGLTRQIKSDIPDLSAKAEKSMASARKSFEDLSAPMPDYTPNAEIEKQLKVSREAANAPINTERDLLSEAILSFGPALGGMVLGENAQIGNTEIQSGARKLFESQRTEKIKYLQDARDKAAKRVEYLEKLKQSDRDSFDKRQERELNKLKAIAESNLKFTEMDSKQLNEAVKQYTEADQKFTDAYEKGSLEYAKMAQTPEELAAKEKRAKIISQGQDLKSATELRKEFISRPEIKDFQQMQAAYGKINASAKNPSAAGDMALIFNYMKMLDPGSTVREGEYASAENARGVPASIVAQYNKVIDGTKLDSSQRRDFVNRAGQMYNSQQKIVSGLESDYKGLAGNYGASSKNVIPRASAPVETSGGYKNGDKRNVKGTTFIYNNGVWSAYGK